MRQSLFVLVLAVFALCAQTAAAAGHGMQTSKVRLLAAMDDGDPGPGTRTTQGPSTLAKVGFFSLGVVASVASLFVAAPVIAALGVEGVGATIIGAVVVLGLSALAHYGLAHLFGIPVSVGSELIGLAGGVAGGVLAVLAVVALSAPQPGLGGLGTVVLALAAGALAYGVLSPLLVLIDPFSLASSAPSPRSQDVALARLPSPLATLPALVTFPVLARSF